MNTSPGTPPTSQRWTSLLVALQSVRRGLTSSRLVRRLAATPPAEARGPYRTRGPVAPPAGTPHPAEWELGPETARAPARGSVSGASAVLVLNVIVMSAFLGARALGPEGPPPTVPTTLMPVHLRLDPRISLANLDTNVATTPQAVPEFGGRSTAAPRPSRR